MSVIDKIENIIKPSIETMGYRLVRVKMLGGQPKTLQIMIDRLNETLADVEDCSKVSEMVGTLLEVDDPITEAYNLEVSTPGIDRPLMDTRDWMKYVGFDFKAEFKDALEGGRRRVRGIIKQVSTEGTVTVSVDKQEFDFKVDNVDSAKLILTDELIKLHSGNE